MASEIVNIRKQTGRHMTWQRYIIAYIHYFVHKIHKNFLFMTQTVSWCYEETSMPQQYLNLSLGSIFRMTSTPNFPSKEFNFQRQVPQMKKKKKVFFSGFTTIKRKDSKIASRLPFVAVLEEASCSYIHSYHLSEREHQECHHHN